MVLVGAMLHRRIGILVVAWCLPLSARAARADKIDDLIQTLVTTDSYKVRVQVCLVLGTAGDRRAVDALLEALRDDNAAVRLVAAKALGKIGDPKALAALNTAANDPVPSVAQAARQAIAIVEKAVRAGPVSAQFYIIIA